MWFILRNFNSSPYWRCYYSNTDAVIYVVDSADRDRIGISKQELVSMLEVSEVINFEFIVPLSEYLQVNVFEFQ